MEAAAHVESSPSCSGSGGALSAGAGQAAWGRADLGQVKDELDWESEAAAQLYKDHVVKDELVLGPEVLQPPDVVFALQASSSARAGDPRARGAGRAPTGAQKNHVNTCFTCDRCIGQVCLRNLRCVEFKKLKFDDKVKVVNIGRCVPQLQITQKMPNKTRRFHKKYYEDFSWMTGCIHTERLYCFPCTLFGKCTSVWNDAGFVDIRNIKPRGRKHEQSENHLMASIKLATFGRGRIDTSFNSQLAFDKERHNDKVERNRHAFQRLIDVVCFLGKQELAFRDLDESESSLNLELVDLLPKYDGVLTTHLETSTSAFSGLSKQTRKDLFSSVASVVNYNIKQQIKESEFVAVMADSTGGREQLILMLRYVHNAQVIDRFIKYVDVSLDQPAATLCSTIIETLEEYDCLSKVVAQTYDGVAVSQSDLRGVQALVREKCPHALYVWCSAHGLNVILSKAFERCSETNRFFSILKTLVNFFHGGTKRANFYDLFSDMKKLPRDSETRWSFHSQLVNRVLRERFHLTALFEEMLENENDKWDGDTLQQAAALSFHFKEFEFNFFLKIFSDIFAKSDILYENLHNKTWDTDYCVEKIDEFELFMTNYRSTFEIHYSEAKQVAAPPKRKRNISNPETHYERIFVKIVDDVQSECRRRYSNIKELTFFALLSNENFDEYMFSFPENVLRDLVNTYVVEDVRKFNIDLLKTELGCIYKSPEFKNDDAYSIIQNLYGYHLHNVFPEVVRLAKLITTVPASSASAVRSFSCLTRVHTHMRNTQGQQRDTDLSLIYIEQELLREIKRLPTFYDSVLQSYLKKDRCVDLVYK